MVICFGSNKLGINILSVAISFILVFFISNGLYRIKNLQIGGKPNLNGGLLTEENINTNVDTNSDVSSDISNDANNDVNNNESSKYEWALRIPKIDLYAQIEEGTTAEILNQSIGHFEETQKKVGNIGLASHNRGYKVNYFARLKELEVGDEIYYTFNEKEEKYTVSEILVIYETDWKMLENTEDNRLTLITCIENREKYRLCVQAVQN